MSQDASVTVRRLTVADLQPYRSIRLEAVKTEPTAFGGSFEDEILLADSFYENQLTKVWATSESGVFGAFDHHGELNGTIGLFKRGGRKLCHKTILWGMFVRATARQSGVGRKLLETAIEFANAIQAEFIELTVVSENLPAIRLYESLGFITWGREPAALKYLGRNYDELHMIRPVP